MGLGGVGESRTALAGKVGVDRKVVGVGGWGVEVGVGVRFGVSDGVREGKVAGSAPDWLLDMK